MTSPVASTSASAAPATTGTDWTVQVADTIESVVGAVRDKTTAPIEVAARAVVYGVLIATMLTVALTLAGVGLIRLLSTWLQVWAVYSIVGGLFTVAGMLCWSFRRPRKRG